MNKQMSDLLPCRNSWLCLYFSLPVLILFLLLAPETAYSAPADKQGITIFATPRSTSTLLFRIFAMSPLLDLDASCLEPFGEAENILHPIPGNLPSGKSFDQAIQAGKNCIRKTPAVGMMKVIKTMSFRYGEYMDRDDLDYLIANTHPVFLIRYPADSILSAAIMLSKLDQKPLNNEEAIARLDQIGFSASRKLFDYIAARQGYSPLVIEAEEYTGAPSFVLRRYFQSLGLLWNLHIPQLDKIYYPEHYYHAIKTSTGPVPTWFERALSSETIEPLKRKQRNHNIDIALWETISLIMQQAPSALSSDPETSWGEAMEETFLTIRSLKQQIKDYHYLRMNGLRPRDIKIRTFERPPGDRL